VQGLPGCLPWGMILTFMNDYLAQVCVPTSKGLAFSQLRIFRICYGFEVLLIHNESLQPSI